MAEAARKDTKEIEESVKANAEAKAKTNAETMERQNNSKPTPTQEENDLAAAGQHVDEKEYDGSPAQGTTPEGTKAAEAAVKKQSEAKPSGSATYATRSATPKPAS